jgi:hypothetical protein
MVNVNKKRHKFHIICYVHYNEHHDPVFFIIFFIVIFIFTFDNEDILRGNLFTWHNTYNMHEKIKLVQKKIVYIFCNDNTHMN